MSPSKPSEPQSGIPALKSLKGEDALVLAQSSGGKLTRSPLGYWVGSSDPQARVEASEVARLVKDKRMEYTQRADIGDKRKGHATEATVI